MSLLSSVNIPAHVLSESLSGETVLLDMSSGKYFGLTPVASRFWQLLQGGMPPAAAKTQLLQEFDTTAEVLEQDLAKLLSELESRKLISRQAA